MRMFSIGIVAALILSACSSPSTNSSDYPAGKAGLEEMGEALLEADFDRNALFATLKPTLSDCKLFYGDAAIAEEAFEHYDRQWSVWVDDPFKPVDGQNSVVALECVKEGWQQDALPEDYMIWSGGNIEVAAIVPDGTKWYQLRFVNAVDWATGNNKQGRRLEGFFHTGEKWVLFSKPWMVLF